MPDEVEIQAPAQSQRLLSLDAYRGGVMFFLAAASIASLTPALGRAFFPDAGTWQFDTWYFLSTQWSHADWRTSTESWTGFRLWDMIQPAFMFMVGVSMPFSYGKRQELGHSYLRMFGHVVYRAIFLILLGVFLRSLYHPQTRWTFDDVVTQIGLGYIFLFLLWNRNWKTQTLWAGAILVGYWALWRFWPNISETLDALIRNSNLKETAVSGWPEMVGREVPVGTPGHAFDVWFLNLFPRRGAFTNHPYPTLNFIPSLVTMIFGLMAGQLLRDSKTPKRQLTLLIACGLAGVVAGLAADWLGICPIVKKTWTPSWTVFSGGICVLLLACLYWIVDVLGFRRWTLLFTVFGVNSIAIYILTWTWKPFLQGNVKRHLTPMLPADSQAWNNLIVAVVSFALLWLLFYWMYRRKIFLRI